MVEKGITEELDETGTASGNDGVEHESEPTEETVDVRTEPFGEDNESSSASSAESEIAALRKELQETSDRLIRQAAEFQNYRRRTEQEKSQMVQFGKGMVIEQLLDVFDDLRRSIEAADQVDRQPDHADGAAYDSLRSGVELVYQKMMDELKKLDVEPIESVGAVFDERYHEAVMQQPVPEDEEDGVVLTEVQRGYKLGDRVLRHAKVIVSRRQADDA